MKGKPLAFTIIFTAFLASAFCASAARAATLTIAASPSAALGQSFLVNVVLDTQGDDVNALQGEIVFPPNLFTLKDINDGSSPISLWIEPPHETASGTIVFSGIIPGGFTGSASSVVSAALVPIANGIGSVDIQNAQLLRNDGNGSMIALTTAGQAIGVGSSISTPSAELFPSSTTPQTFIPIVAQDPDIYGGAYFLVFSTTDKGSGIDHYEVLEVPSGESVESSSPWSVATSPYLLTDQGLSSDIYVRAVGHDGNFIIVKVPARHPRVRWDIWGLLGAGVLIVLVVLSLFVWMRRRRRHT